MSIQQDIYKNQISILFEVQLVSFATYYDTQRCWTKGLLLILNIDIDFKILFNSSKPLIFCSWFFTTYYYIAIFVHNKFTQSYKFHYSRCASIKVMISLPQVEPYFTKSNINKTFYSSLQAPSHSFVSQFTYSPLLEFIKSQTNKFYQTRFKAKVQQ